MDDNEIIWRLSRQWIGVTEHQARIFLALYREMQEIDREIAEADRCQLVVGENYGSQ